MNSDFVRRFVFRTRDDVDAFLAFLRANYEPMAKQERFLQVVASAYREKRSNTANAYYWGVLLTTIAEQAVVAGVRYTIDLWAEFYKQQYLPELCARGVEKWKYLPNGNRVLVMGSSDLNKAEFQEFLQKIEAHAVSELGVQLPANPRNL